MEFTCNLYGKHSSLFRTFAIELLGSLPTLITFV